jgi:hypothetical protein
MTEHPILEPIELTDAELDAVSGGRAHTSVAAGVSQRIDQSVQLAQVGGDLNIGGGNGATSSAGIVTFVETFAAVITQVANNINTGNVTVTIGAIATGGA